MNVTEEQYLHLQRLVGAIRVISFQLVHFVLASESLLIFFVWQKITQFTISCLKSKPSLSTKQFKMSNKNKRSLVILRKKTDTVSVWKLQRYIFEWCKSTKVFMATHSQIQRMKKIVFYLLTVHNIRQQRVLLHHTKNQSTSSLHGSSSFYISRFKIWIEFVFLSASPLHKQPFGEQNSVTNIQ